MHCTTYGLIFDEFKKNFLSEGAKLNERPYRKKLILFCKKYHKIRLMGIILTQRNEKIQISLQIL